MQLVPLATTEAQTLNIVLNNQICQINVYQKFYGVFVDLYVNNTLIIGGVIAQNLNRIVISAYLGFKGDLMFLDTEGDDDPDWTGLGTRWILIYITPIELAAAGLSG